MELITEFVNLGIWLIQMSNVYELILYVMGKWLIFSLVKSSKMSKRTLHTLL